MITPIFVVTNNIVNLVNDTRAPEFVTTYTYVQHTPHHCLYPLTIHCPFYPHSAHIPWVNYFSVGDHNHNVVYSYLITYSLPSFRSISWDTSIIINIVMQLYQSIVFHFYFYTSPYQSHSCISQLILSSWQTFTLSVYSSYNISRYRTLFQHSMSHNCRRTWLNSNSNSLILYLCYSDLKSIVPE